MLIDLLKQEEKYLIETRRYLHIHPELSPNETNTCQFIMQELKRFEIPYEEIADGGIIAHLKGNRSGRRVALRADMDALPIAEDSKNILHPKVCVSSVEQVSHACGHDAHTAMLLTAAKVLAEHKDSLCGEVIFIFERGEEDYFGYKNLVPALKKYLVDVIFGLHVYAELGSSKIAVLDDVCMSGNGCFHVTIHGKGCHGASPHQGIDPITCVAEMITSLQIQMLRCIAPDQIRTFSIGEIKGGSRWNVIPEEASFCGSFRFYDSAVGDKQADVLKRTIKEIAAAHECTADINLIMAPAVINDRTVAAIARKSIVKAAGPASLTSCSPWMASETVAFFLQDIPGAFAFLGIKNKEKGTGAPHHNAKFDLDEDSLLLGVSSLVEFTENYLNCDMESMMAEIMLEKVVELRNITVKHYVRTDCNAYLESKNNKNYETSKAVLLASLKKSYEEDGCKKAYYLIRYPEYL